MNCKYKMSQYLYLIDTNNRGDLIEEVLQRRSQLKNIFQPKSLKKSWTAIQENKWNLIWKTTVNFTPNLTGPNMNKLKPFLSDGKVNLFDLSKFDLPNRLKIINHFPNPEIITKKTELVRSLKYKADFIPETYILRPGDLKSINKFLENYHNSDIWILKPEYLHSGKGIEIFDKLEDIVKYFEENLYLDSKSESKGLKDSNKKQEWVMQKYINNPFLLNGRKFDIRINVLVTKNFDIYVNPFGFIKTISEKYVPYLTGNFQHDRLVHITNHSVQKNSENYGVLEEGNVMSLQQFQTYLDLTFGNNKFDIYRDFFPRWNEIIIDVILSNRKKLSQIPGQKFNQNVSLENIQYFEMYGFDILLDEFGRSWLLEVNTNPGLEQDNSWAIHVVRNMLEELAQICIDPFIVDKSTDKSVKSIKNDIFIPPKNLRWEKYITKEPIPEWYNSDRIDPEVQVSSMDETINLSKSWNLIYSEQTKLNIISHQVNMSKILHQKMPHRNKPVHDDNWLYPYS